MKITILGPAYPYRGGLASIMETLARTFAEREYVVDIKTFTVQYPEMLFPGKTQFSNSKPPQNLQITRCVNTVNPFNWIKVGRAIREDRPDILIMRYWTPFMGPCFGKIARLARKNGHTKVLVQLDNVIPHEGHATDDMFTRYFVNSVDGFLYMSRQVKADLDTFGSSAPTLFSPHPLFTNFGDKVSKEDACRNLDLDPDTSYSLFFGFIREYKGLDLLLDMWEQLKVNGQTHGRKLIVAGEFFHDKGKYVDMILNKGLADDVMMHDYFIKDDMVKYFFSAADLLIQPYKSATQSGVTQIAYHFDLPMIVTDVGGLSEIVPDDVTGFVAQPTADSLMEAFEKFCVPGVAQRLVANMEEQKKRFSWSATADKFEELYVMTGDIERPQAR